MATIDKTMKQFGGTHAGARGAVVLSNTIDCKAQGVSALDVVKALAVGAGDLVLAVVAHVLTAEGATLTVNVGDGTDPDGYLAAVNGNVLGITGTKLALTEATPNTVAGYSGGKLYTEDDSIDLVFNNAASNAVIKVSALVARLG